MAPGASPPAKRIPTIPPSAERPNAAPANTLEPAVAAPATLAWPAAIPPLIVALEIVRGRCPAPPELETATEAFGRSLTFVESAALHAPEASEEIDVLCASSATRWRVMAALAVRPAGEVAPNAAAFEELLHEVDGALASLGKLKEHADADLQQACDSARAALAKDVQKLLPSADERAAGVDSKADLKQLRSALAAAAKSEQRSGKGLRGIGQTKRTIAAAGLVLVTVASVGFAATRLLLFEQPRPVPVLPQPPANTEVLGNPESGTVILRSKDGKPLEPETFEKFRAGATAAGARVQLLGPTQALVTSAP